MPNPSNPDALRVAFQEIVHRFGLLAPDRTPCGQALPPASAHALTRLLADESRAYAPKQNELAAALMLDKSNITRLCARLEDAGHVARKVDGEDRRVRRLRLTAKGRRVARRVDDASRGKFERVFNAIPAQERAKVIEGLAILARAVDESEDSI